MDLDPTPFFSDFKDAIKSYFASISISSTLLWKKGKDRIDPDPPL
jgi:hypothetical protein